VEFTTYLKDNSLILSEFVAPVKAEEEEFSDPESQKSPEKAKII
jgi:hypothetical protein